jgi:hypothetical protein
MREVLFEKWWRGTTGSLQYDEFSKVRKRRSPERPRRRGTRVYQEPQGWREPAYVRV